MTATQKIFASRSAVWLLACAMAFSAAQPSSAAACSVGACSADGLLPSGGSVPANLPGFLWRQGAARSDDAQAIFLSKQGANGSQPVPFKVAPVLEPDVVGSLMLIVPEQALEVGAQYVLSVPDHCAAQVDARREATFAVTPAVAVPTQLGRLEAKVQTGAIKVPNTASCSSEVYAAYVDLSLQIGPEVAAHGGVLRYEPFADGLPARLAKAPQRPGFARLYTLCGEADPGVVEGLAPGPHRVKMTALLPDQTRIESQEIWLELTCPTNPAARCSMLGPTAENRTPVIPCMLLLAGLARYRRRALRRRVNATE